VQGLRRVAGLTGLALAMGAGPAAGQELIRGYFGAGTSAPLGSLADDAKVGYNFLLGVSARAPFYRTSLRFDAMFTELTQQRGFPGYAQFVSGNLNAQYTFADWPLAPYLFAGPGYYFLRGDLAPALGVVLPTTLSSPYQSSHFGVDAGVGMRYRLQYLSVFLEGRDNLVFVGKSQRTYVPVTAGVSIPYPWGEPGTTGVP
jgi:hypothetical protein